MPLAWSFRRRCGHETYVPYGFQRGRWLSKEQRFRHAKTREIYGGILRGFQRFVSKHSADGSLSVSILQQWLKERSLRWPRHILYHRALRVERFLRWLQDRGVIAESPFVPLHTQYGPRTTPIVRSLVSEDAQTALEKLRRLPRFGSFLGRVMEEHVERMRSLGYRYRTNEQYCCASTGSYCTIPSWLGCS